MKHAIELVANALHGDQCPDDPDPGDRCNCGADDFHRQAEIALDTLREAGLLAPAPLTEIRAENQFGETHRRWATDWELVDRAEGDWRAGQR